MVGGDDKQGFFSYKGIPMVDKGLPNLQYRMMIWASRLPGL